MNASKTQLMLGGKVRCADLEDFNVVVDGVTRAGLSSLNELIVHAVAMETCRAFYSQDGPEGSRNALGQVLFPSNVATRSTRSEAAGDVSPDLPYAAYTMVDNGIAMWNKFPTLREASTKRMASNALILAACLALACAMPQYGGNQGNPGSPQDPNEDANEDINGSEVPAQYDYEDGQQTQADEQGDEFAPAQGNLQNPPTFFESHDKTNLEERRKRSAMPQYDEYGDNQGNLGSAQDPSEDANEAEVPAQYDYEDGQQTQADEQGDEFAPAQGSSQGSSTFF
eukprot:maker-scaffold1074_size64407-snap-gene-0.15 protein:Tk01737 transcript:maker-scaffold1074_size64407-snap-gene-0.15-mRNA-1 annotation:"sulfate permease"